MFKKTIKHKVFTTKSHKKILSKIKKIHESLIKRFMIQKNYNEIFHNN